MYLFSDNEEKIGYCGLYIVKIINSEKIVPLRSYLKNEYYGYIDYFYVKPNSRKKGYGKMIMDVML